MSLTVSRQSPVYTKVGKQYVPARIASKVRTKRFVLPVLTMSALGITMNDPIQAIVRNRGSPEGFKVAGLLLLRNFTGMDFSNPQNPHFRFRYMLEGLVPLVAVSMINKSGIFKGVNQRLGRYRIPLRLS